MKKIKDLMIGNYISERKIRVVIKMFAVDSWYLSSAIGAAVNLNPKQIGYGGYSGAIK